MDHIDAARLDQLESDIAAVAAAMESVDRIVAEGGAGESVAAEIAGVVSPQRFPVDGDADPAVVPPLGSAPEAPAPID